MLKKRIASLESLFCGSSSYECREYLNAQNVDAAVLGAAMQLKTAAAQIDVVIHAIGILLSLPHILESGECVESLSLGAGNTGKDFDLETDRRVAEFKFAQWNGSAETVRKRQLFKAVYHLAEYRGGKKSELYVLDKERQIRFLNGNSNLRRMLQSKPLIDDFEAKYADDYGRVSDYFRDVGHRVEIIDLRDVVPEFATQD